MDKAISSWLSKHELSQDVETALTKKLSKSYTIYGSMLLLPTSALEGPEWNSIDTYQKDRLLQELWKCIANALKITHIALNKPIPPLQNGTQDENVLRAPTNFTPLHGDFGPTTCSSPPTPSDFDEAFWVTAKQNAITQVWSPRWTMFSRGNISEKARLLALPSVLQAVQEGRESGKGSCAVDLYAGIGYFAFSYVKAGISKVLCWDLNPWSCEGLRRGARANKWELSMFRVTTCGENEELENMRDLVGDADVRLGVFNETNKLAPDRIQQMREQLPPVRHVNCGMLPSSRESLKLAAQILDGEWLGWVHVHENFLVEEIEAKAEQTRQEFQELLRQQRGQDIKAEIDYINRLKSYAPGVMHCVIDIAVHP